LPRPKPDASSRMRECRMMNDECRSLARKFRCRPFFILHSSFFIRPWVALLEPCWSLVGALLEPCWSLRVALGWLYRRFRVALGSQSVGYQQALESHWGGFDRLCQAYRGSKLGVGCWMFGVYHKESEYKLPVLPRWGWSGGTMVPPWYHDIPITHPGNPIFDQTSLSKPISGAVSGVKILSALDAGRRMSDVPAATPAEMRLVSSRRGIICR
jgi:hypothetical protein